jgi:hypothetical protein
VPKAGGGWLTTELVCKECNSFLGDHVDNIMNEPLLKAMRVEAGLATKDILDGVYFDADLGEVPGYLHEDGSFVETKDYFKRGGGEFVVIAPTPEKARLRGDEIAEARARRGKTTQLQEPVSRPSVPVPTSLGGGDAKSLFPRLGREAAKIAVGYVAHVAGPEVALSSALDAIRSAALNGTQLDGEAGLLRAYWRGIHFPRVNATFLFGDAGTQQPALKDVPQLMENEASGFAQSVRAAGRLTNIRHELSLRKASNAASFSLILFGALGAHIELPHDLNLPTMRHDYRDFARGKSGSGYA